MDKRVWRLLAWQWLLSLALTFFKGLLGIFFFLLVWKFRAPVVPFQASANSFFQVPVFLPCKESTMPKPDLELSCGFLSMLPSLFPLGISTLLQGYKGLKLRQSQAKIQGFLESPFCYPLANYLYLLHPLPAPSPTVSIRCLQISSTLLPLMDLWRIILAFVCLHIIFHPFIAFLIITGNM